MAGQLAGLSNEVTENSKANDRLDLNSRSDATGTRQDEDWLRNLMVRYQEGDPIAVETLVASLSPALLRFCGGPGMSPGDAEDVLQDCWLRVHRSRHTYHASEPLLPWIYAVARHARLDACRQKGRRAAREVLVGGIPEPASRSPASDSGVMELVNQLPDSQREVVVMLKLDGMSIAEAARATSATVGAIKQKAHRAYVTLRRMLNENVRE